MDAIARVRGVGQVTLFGGADYAMRIWVSPDRLAQLKLTIPDITKAVQQQNVIVPGGQIGGPPAPKGTEFTYAVRTSGRLSTEEQFGAVIVRTNPDGSQVHLRDVARLELGDAELQLDRPPQRQARRRDRDLPDARLERARRRG